MNTALATTEYSLDELQRTAKMLVASGYFDAKGESHTQIAQLATKILAGRELGYGPFASVQGIHVIQGKPQISANLMAAAVKAHPRYDYRVRKMSDDCVSIEFYENGQSLGTSEFSKADAAKAKTQNMDKFPRNMMFARALSNGVRWYCPDVFHGNAVYVEGEIEEVEADRPAIVVVDKDTGEVVEGITTNGNGHKAPPEPETVVVDAPEPDMISKLQLARVHILGKELYDMKEEWDAKRPAIIQGLTKGAVTSSKDLTASQADALITMLQKRVNAKQPDPVPNLESAVDIPF